MCSPKRVCIFHLPSQLPWVAWPCRSDLQKVCHLVEAALCLAFVLAPLCKAKKCGGRVLLIDSGTTVTGGLSTFIFALSGFTTARRHRHRASQRRRKDSSEIATQREHMTCNRSVHLEDCQKCQPVRLDQHWRLLVDHQLKLLEPHVSRLHRCCTLPHPRHLLHSLQLCR